jgi:hypothetical protein
MSHPIKTLFIVQNEATEVLCSFPNSGVRAEHLHLPAHVQVRLSQTYPTQETQQDFSQRLQRFASENP